MPQKSFLEIVSRYKAHQPIPNFIALVAHEPLRGGSQSRMARLLAVAIGEREPHREGNMKHFVRKRAKELVLTLVVFREDNDEPLSEIVSRPYSAGGKKEWFYADPYNVCVQLGS